MKMQWRTCLVASVLAFLLMLSGCGRKNLEYDTSTGQYIRRGDGAIFYRASGNYCAMCIDRDREVCKIVGKDEADIILYEICNNVTDVYMDPSIWMSDEDYRVYYAEGTTLPKLWEMQVKEIYVTDGGEKSRVVGWIEEAADVSSIISLYQSGTTVRRSDLRATFQIVDLKTRYELAFSSQSHEGIYYMLNYYGYEENIVYTEEVADPASFTPSLNRAYTLSEKDGVTYAKYDLGKHFLYDQVTGICYPLDSLADLIIKA